MLPIAQEAWLPLSITAVAAVVIQAATSSFYAALPFWLLSLTILTLFRDFPRKIPSQPLAVVSPVDGIVVGIISCPSPISDENTLCIQIRQTWHGEYSIHNPIDGRVNQRWWPNKNGENMPFFGFWIQSNEKDDVIVNARMRKRRFLSFKSHYAPTGQRVAQGRRCGFIGPHLLFEVYLPQNAYTQLKVGQHVMAGVDRLGSLKHHT